MNTLGGKRWWRWVLLGVLAIASPAQAGLFKRADWKLEKYFGKATEAEMAGQYGFSRNRTLTLNVERLGRNIARHSHRRDTVQAFYLVESAEVNAFAAPGGYVFVTRGLLQRLNNEDELAGVMGHEWGHVAAKHGMKTIKKWPVTMAIGLAAGKYLGGKGARALEMALSLTALHYSRENEYQADELGVAYALDRGYDPRRMADFFMKLEAEQPMGRLHRLDVALASHPRTLNRMAALRRLVEKSQKNTPAWARLARSLRDRGQITRAYDLLRQQPQIARASPQLAKSIHLAVGAGPRGVLPAPWSPLPVAGATPLGPGETQEAALEKALAHFSLPASLPIAFNKTRPPGLSALASLPTQVSSLFAAAEDWPLPQEAMDWINGLALAGIEADQAQRSLGELAQASVAAQRALALGAQSLAQSTRSPAWQKELAASAQALRLAAAVAPGQRLQQSGDRLERMAQNLGQNASLAEMTLAPGQRADSLALEGGVRETQFWLAQTARERREAQKDALALRRETENHLAKVIDLSAQGMGALERVQLPRLLAHRLVVKPSEVKTLLAAKGLKVSDVAFVVEARRQGLLKGDAPPKKKELAAARAILSDMDVLLGWVYEDMAGLWRGELGGEVRWPGEEEGRHAQPWREALAHFLTGSPDKAVTLLRQLQKDKTFKPKARAAFWLQAAQAEFLAGHRRRASTLLLKVLGLEPQNTQALNLLGLYAADTGQRARLWQESLQLNPNQPVIASRLAALVNSSEPVLKVRPGLLKLPAGGGKAPWPGRKPECFQHFGFRMRSSMTARACLETNLHLFPNRLSGKKQGKKLSPREGI